MFNKKIVNIFLKNINIINRINIIKIYINIKKKKKKKKKTIKIIVFFLIIHLLVLFKMPIDNHVYNCILLIKYLFFNFCIIFLSIHLLQKVFYLIKFFIFNFFFYFLILF